MLNFLQQGRLCLFGRNNGRKTELKPLPPASPISVIQFSTWETIVEPFISDVLTLYCWRQRIIGCFIFIGPGSTPVTKFHEYVCSQVSGSFMLKDVSEFICLPKIGPLSNSAVHGLILPSSYVIMLL